MMATKEWMSPMLRSKLFVRDVIICHGSLRYCFLSEDLVGKFCGLLPLANVNAESVAEFGHWEERQCLSTALFPVEFGDKVVKKNADFKSREL